MIAAVDSHILIIVPCYNEQDTIESVVAGIYQTRDKHRLNLDVLVVNDCSTDRSVEAIRQTGCLYLNLPTNLGIGGAMHAGYKFAWRNGYDIAVQMDGDGQHPTHELPKLLQPLFNNQADVVIGSRFITREGFQSSATRRMGITYFRWLNQFLIGQTIHDSTSGFRAFNRKTLALVERYYPDEYPEPEAIVQFGLNKLRMLEVPVVMSERQGGVSSINTSRAVYYMIKVTLGILFIFLRLRNRPVLTL
ncbi:glycosyltransferase family 2 protein [Rudanella lutea]|uniref:glycosyltransferase family 2 protein n=1 Tax=Rudanella lutea TaxID=451374 RepID=UPI00048091D1|nr:glycosyltransferase family 2 protein [Rudanella lutea]